MSRILFFILMLSVLRVSSQTPAKCFEIESILVDACSSPEGENEMVRFHIGSAPLNVANFSADWPNPMNPWQGICQNGGTAATVAAMNASVLGCGVLLEPTGGVLPADAQVIVITSEDVNPLANSFENLNDTIYVIFQCAGNTAGHFVNNGPSDTRTLIMSFGGGGGCGDTVTYDRGLLVNTNGTTGGSAAVQDGSSVAYAWNGTPTYYNNGCVAPITELIADAGNDTTVCEGAPVPLNGSRQGGTGTAWTSTQGAFTDSTILNPVFTPVANATYPIEVILRVFTTCGDTISDTMLVSRFTGAIDAGIDATICNGQSTQLLGSGSNSYNWTTSMGAFVSNAQSPTVNPIATTSYVLTGSFGANNCPDTDTVVVTVNARDSIVIAASEDSVCNGASTVLTASGGSSYLWSPNNGTISDINIAAPTVTPTVTATYTVQSSGGCADTASVLITVTPADSVFITASATTLCEGASAQLTANGGTGYLWSPNDGTISDVNSSTPTVTPLVNTTYTVASLGDCPGNASVLITVIPDVPVTVIPSNAVLCAGQSIQLTASGGAGFVWSPDDGSISDVNSATPTVAPLATTTYSVVRTVCPDTAFAVVTVNQRDVLSVSASDSAICVGGTVQLNVSGSTGYLWSPDNGSLSDINSASPAATPGVSTTYFVVSSGACPDTASVSVVVDTDTVLTITAPETVCEGQQAQLNVSGGSNYQWTPATGLSCTNCADPVAVLSDATTYTVTSTGLCNATASVTIDVTPPVTISVSGDTMIYQGESSTLTATGGDSYVWAPTTGLNTSSGATVIASPLETTTYTVTDSANACAVEASITVTVLLLECPKAAIPTAFSPDGQGPESNNDFGVINADSFSSVEMHIYNRWGEKVFSTNTGGRWDGTYQGEPQPISTYVYTVTAVCEFNNQRLQLNGCVTLVR